MNKYNFDFLLLEFKNLHYGIVSIENEVETEKKIEKVMKLLKEIIITTYLKNNIFYNPEEEFINNIKELAKKEILPYSLMKYLINYIEELELVLEILEENNKDEFKDILDYNFLYEILIWLVTTFGEEKYSLFYNNLNEDEKKIFKRYIEIDEDEEDSYFEEDYEKILEKDSEKENFESENFDIDYSDGEDFDLENIYGDEEDDEYSKDEYLLTGEIYYIGKGVKKDYYKAKEFFKKSAENGNQYAQSYLGLFYEKGYTGEKDIEKALYWYKKSAAKGNVFSQYSLGYIYFTGIDVEVNVEYAYKSYKEAANQNFPPAQYALSYLYKNGIGCEKNIFKAYYWLEASAENNFEDAFYIIGQSYLDGLSIEKDYKKAYYYLLKGAEKGDENCLESLGDMHYKGLHVEQDRDKAFEYYNESIDKGNFKIYYKLGKLYEDEDEIDKAFITFMKGHNNGDLKSSQKLGIMYYNGEGVTKDEKKALEYMESAIEDEDSHSLYIIGTIYLNLNRQKGIEYLRKAYDKGSHYAAEILASEYLIDILSNEKVDEKELIKFIEFAMKKDLQDAIYYRGLTYIYGIGCEIDKEKAFSYFLDAAEKGSEKAMIKLGNCYLHGVFVKEDIKQSIKWFNRAIEFDSVEGILSLIEIYEQGLGIEKNYEKAIELAYILRDLDILEGDIKLALYNAKKVGSLNSDEMARGYLEEIELLNPGRAYNLLGELAEEGLLNLKSEDVIRNYIKGIENNSENAYINLKYYNYKNNLNNKEVDKILEEYKGKFIYLEKGKAYYLSGINFIEKGIKNGSKTEVRLGIRDLKKSIQLGFYEGIKYLVNYYENQEKNLYNLKKLYKFKYKLHYYGLFEN